MKKTTIYLLIIAIILLAVILLSGCAASGTCSISGGDNKYMEKQLINQKAKQKQ